MGAWLFLWAWLAEHAVRVAWLHWRWVHRHVQPAPVFCRRAKVDARAHEEDSEASPALHSRRKPQWVRAMVLEWAMHGLSCRAIAARFNRFHGLWITISKSWVGDLVKVHALLIADGRRAMRRRPPIAYKVNRTWGLDLTFWTNPQGGMHSALGIIDHGSRRLLCMRDLPRKCTLTLLGHLLLVMARFGVPAVIHTDNESMFRSALWKAVLKALGVCHRRSRLGCPWDNGRIERLFGTLKPLLRKVQPATKKAFRKVLAEFRWFYNNVRVHQNLHGLTPMEVWHGKTLTEVQQAHVSQPARWVSAMDGALAGYYVRC